MNLIESYLIRQAESKMIHDQPNDQFWKDYIGAILDSSKTKTPGEIQAHTDILSAPLLFTDRTNIFIGWEKLPFLIDPYFVVGWIPQQNKTLLRFGDFYIQYTQEGGLERWVL